METLSMDTAMLGGEKDTAEKRLLFIKVKAF